MRGFQGFIYFLIDVKKPLNRGLSGGVFLFQSAIYTESKNEVEGYDSQKHVIVTPSLLLTCIILLVIAATLSQCLFS